MRLWHYTCSHSINGILDTAGTLRPNPHPGVQPRATALARSLGSTATVRTLPLIWLTDVRVVTLADAALIGLKGIHTDCNRVEFRFRVPNSPSIVWWPTWADVNLDDFELRKLLEMECSPANWWVSETPLRNCRLDQSYVPPTR